jgi:hypothetical protein
MQELQSGEISIDPLLYAPPSCHRGMAKKLVEQSGDTYQPAQTNTTTPNTTASDAARKYAASAAALVFFSWVLIVAAV